MESGKRFPEVDIVQRRADFLAELRSQIEFPPNNEEVTRQFHDAALFCNVKYAAYRTLTNAYLASEPVPVPSYWLNKFFKAHQIELLRPEMRDSWDYPEAFNDSAVWREFITTNLSQPDTQLYKNVFNNLQHRLQINRWKRKQAPAFLMGAMREHNTNPFVVHEYGSAENLVLKALATRAIADTVVCSEGSIPDHRMSERFNSITALAELGKGYGVEINAPTTEEDHHRIKGYTLDPSQLDSKSVDGREEDTYDMLVELPPPSVKLISGDFLRLPDESAKELQQNKADIAFLSHVLPQNPGRLEEVLSTVLSNVKPSGIILVNEYASPDPANTKNLIYPSNWYSSRWQCATMGLLADRPEEGFFTIFNWETAHCERVRLVEEGLGRLALDVVLKES